MPGAERDSTQDWLLPGHRTPPTVAELQDRIDEALATARASEAAVMTVGAAALDAAEQARRAAELAEQAASTAAGIASSAQGKARAGEKHPKPGAPVSATKPDSMRDFSERADRLVERLQQIQRLPLTRSDARQHTR